MVLTFLLNILKVDHDETHSNVSEATLHTGVTHPIIPGSG
jgi:hypothetical protein